MTKLAYALRCGLVAAVALFGVAAQQAGAATDHELTLPPTYIGEKQCAECHDTENKMFGHTQHAAVFRANPRNEIEAKVCEACHGPGSKHAVDTRDKQAIIGFSKGWGTPIAEQNAQCLTCHSKFWEIYVLS